MRPKRLSDRNFGLIFAGIFLLIGIAVWLFNRSFQTWAIALAAAFFLTSLFKPILLMPLNRLWEEFGHRLGVVSNALLLGVFFYLVVTPFGLAMRLVSSDPMKRRGNKSARSYFTPVGRQATRETFPDMF